jgi:hypothetical protein
MSTTAWHCGHFPRFPAIAAGVRTIWLQAGHENSMVWSELLPAEEDDRLPDKGESIVAEEPLAEPLDESGVPGICTTAPHCGHFPFLPAVASGVRTICRQAGQEKSIGISDGKSQRTEDLRNQRANCGGKPIVQEVL